MSSLPAGPLITWYGDDFTGSTDALEVLARGGLKAVLFLEQPAGDEARREMAGMQAAGLAGISRSQSPRWMSENLPGMFSWLRATGARICHYKVCSTFDSSPETGNIGRAVEIGRAIFQTPVVPIIAGAPGLRRYTAFGNLFASFGSEVYRIDRHPAMSRHPVTPMLEADLRRHLALQTSLGIGLISLPEMLSGEAPRRLQELADAGCEAAVLDVFDDASLVEAGRAIWPAGGEPPRFVAGSSGVEHSLIAWWRAARALPPEEAGVRVEGVDRVVVLSGSCSPATSRQIRRAMQCGYEAIAIDAATVAQSEAEVEKLTAAAAAALARGKSVVLYTWLEGAGGRPGAPEGEERVLFGEELGTRCGRLLRTVLLASGVRRVVIAGGDTSSHAGRQLGLRALTFKAPLAAGAPLCEASASDPHMRGLEVVFKGGQIGDDGFFELVRTGAA